MASQWPQYTAPPPAYGYTGYQHQYPQQQYGPPQSAPYQPPYQQPANPGYGQPVAQPSPHTCYNCGSQEHWAQDCPEPRREVPAGSLNQQANFSRPVKRYKPNGPVITKYPVPPHLNQTYAPTQAYGGAPYGQHGLPQRPPSYGPPTPVSAYPPPNQQWQHPPQYQYHQPPYQQGNSYHQPSYQQGSTYPPRPYSVAPPPPSPGSYYGSHNPSPVSAQGSQYDPAFQLHHAQYQQPQGPQVPYNPEYSNVPPSFTGIPPQKSRSNQYVDIKSTESRNIRSGSLDSAPMLSQSTTPKPQQVVLPHVESDEIEWDTLDVPDIPRYPRSDGEGFAYLVGRPLPADSIAADAISPIPAPPFESDGRCQSRYLNRGTLEPLIENIKSTGDWDNVKDDPIFLSVVDGNIILFEDVIPIRGRRQPNDPEDEADWETKEPSYASQTMVDGSETWDVMDSLEHALNAGRSRAPDASYNNQDPIGEIPLSSIPATLDLDEKAKTARETEERLAALGVTGAPKPVRAPARPYPPPPPPPPPPAYDVGPQASHDSWSKSRSNSPARYDIEPRQHNNGSSAFENGYYETDSTIRGHVPSSRKYTVPHGELPLDGEARGSNEKPYSQDIEHLPRKRKHSTYDGVDESPLSSGSSHGNTNGHSNHPAENGNGYSRYSLDGQSMSPVKIRSERVNPRKRDYDHRDTSSDEDETARRRQVDDVTPKLKRRQPKVAEAYSRRW